MKKILWIVLAGAVWASCGEGTPPGSNVKPAPADSAVAAKVATPVAGDIAMADSPDTSVNAPTEPVVETTKDPLEDKIVDTLFKIPQVIAQSKYMEKVTKGKRKLAIMIVTPPSRDQKYYWVKAVEDNGMSLYTHFNFYVYPDSMRIMYLDVVEDRELTLEEWAAKEAKSKP